MDNSEYQYLLSIKQYEQMERIENRIYDTYERLSMDPPSQVPEVGDKVLICGCLVGKGYPWTRLEAEVLDVADTSYYVKYLGCKNFVTNKVFEEWVCSVAITDVIKRKGKEN